MIDMVFPLILAAIGYTISNVGTRSNVLALKIIGGVLAFAGAAWLLYDSCYDLGYAFGRYY